MRVLVIVADGRPGGGTTHVLQILNGLSGFFSFELITQSGSYLLQEAKKIGVPCHGTEFFLDFLNPFVSARLGHICSRLRADVVHVHGGRAGFFFALARINLPTLYTIHGFHLLQKSLVLRWLAIQAERCTFYRASRIVFVSKYDIAVARKLRLLQAKKPYSLIYNGISADALPQIRTLNVRHIGFIGRLETQKDPLLFLDTLECLHEYTATIVGGGSLDALVRREIFHRGLTNRVRMLGTVSHSEALNVLSTLSSVVLCSRWEGLPLIVLESMSMGVPVVSVNVSGMSEIIEDEISGILVDQRSGQSLANGVKKATEDVSLRTTIIRNAREEVREKFSEEKMLLSLHRVYQEIH